MGLFSETCSERGTRARMRQPPSLRAESFAKRHASWLEPVATLAAIHAVHGLAMTLLHGLVPGLPLRAPLAPLPAWLFTGWDSEHYFHLALRFDRFVWPPLYPLGLRFLGSLFPQGGLEKAAVLINLVSHGATVFLAFALVRQHPRLAGVPGWLLATLLFCFPGHNVFFAAYSESLFLALALGVCVAWYRERLLTAGLLCGLALLVRNMGVYLGAALILVEGLRWLQAPRTREAWGRLARVSAWVPFFVGWMLVVHFVGRTDAVAATGEWQAELIRNHVPPGQAPRLWVLRYLMLPGHKEFLFFWAAVLAGAWSWRRGLRLEAAYVAVFLASFALYLYRPFPFSRYVSVLYPVALMVAHALRRSPALQALALTAGLLAATHTQALLFLHRVGEP